jgi:3-oxoacyl-[acyl-carrier protein] reductase
MRGDELRDRVALVTGVNNPQGIGAATARALVRLGARALVTYWGEAPSDDLLRVIAGERGEVHATEANLADPSAVPALFDRAEAMLGPVEILINNAAASDQDSFVPLDAGSEDWAGRSLATITAESIDCHFAVNARGVALMMAEYARRYLARNASWGRIVNLSTGGSAGFPGEVSYGASKNALESYSRAAAFELAPFGVTVNIVTPGPTQTGWITSEMEETIIGMIPMGRMGYPEDVADAILLLTLEEARFLTGQTLHADGGHKM